MARKIESLPQYLQPIAREADKKGDDNGEVSTAESKAVLQSAKAAFADEIGKPVDQINDWDGEMRVRADPNASAATKKFSKAYLLREELKKGGGVWAAILSPFTMIFAIAAYPFALLKRIFK